MNRHSEIISTIFNSNTNVILAIVGGVMMYVALYTTKDTHEEDVSDYARAGNAIIKKIVAEYGDTLDTKDDEQRTKRGLRLILGTCTMVTRRHKIAAPLASYIIQNGSRFKYSHEFEYFYPGSFSHMDENVTDLML